MRGRQGETFEPLDSAKSPQGNIVGREPIIGGTPPTGA